MCVCLCVGGGGWGCGCGCAITPSRPPSLRVLTHPSLPLPPHSQTSILLNKCAEGQLSIEIGDTHEMCFSSVTFHPNIWYHVVLVHVQVLCTLPLSLALSLAFMHAAMTDVVAFFSWLHSSL